MKPRLFSMWPPAQQGVLMKRGGLLCYYRLANAVLDLEDALLASFLHCPHASPW
jgi:hypothetical protein